MLISEFRTLMQKADRKQLEKIASELYKRIPKAQKEELDETVRQILSGNAITPSASKSAKAIPFSELSSEINAFLHLVDEGCYFKPNRIVPKQKRSKWRFEVMRFIKQLDANPSDEAAALYLALYKRLTYGCAYYTFPSEDPFRAIGISQEEFYSRMVIKYFLNGFSDSKILEMLRAAACNFLDRNTLHEELQIIFIRELKTRDMREKAYRIAKEEVSRLKALKQKQSSNNFNDLDDNINEICITILGLGIALFEEDDAIAFFFSHTREISKEVQLYIALDRIKAFGGSSQLWAKVYDNALTRGIKPRESLVKERKAILL